MEMALTMKKKFEMVDGSSPMPPITSANHKARKKCNNMVKSWIVNSITKNVALSIPYINEIEGVWKDLKVRFSQVNGPRIFQLQKTIYVLAQNSNSVSSYYTQFKGLWDELSNYRPIPLLL